MLKDTVSTAETKHAAKALVEYEQLKQWFSLENTELGMGCDKLKTFIQMNHQVQLESILTKQCMVLSG